MYLISCLTCLFMFDFSPSQFPLALIRLRPFYLCSSPSPRRIPGEHKSQWYLPGNSLATLTKQKMIERWGESERCDNRFADWFDWFIYFSQIISQKNCLSFSRPSSRYSLGTFRSDFLSFSIKWTRRDELSEIIHADVPFFWLTAKGNGALMRKYDDLFSAEVKNTLRH